MDGAKQFSGKTILVTGGAGFIGRATAALLIERGAAVALTDIRDKKDVAESLEAELGAAPGKWEYFSGDATKSEEVAGVVAAVEKWAPSGGIDCLFNNAGIQGSFAPTDQYDESDFAKVLKVNVESVFLYLKHVSAAMKARNKPGAIVNTASRAGVAGPPNMIAYAASKGAVIALSKTAAKDLAPYKIRVNSISPALVGDCSMWRNQVEQQAKVGSQYFPTDPEAAEAQFIKQVPMRRTASLREVAQCVAFLLSVEASYISGDNMSVSGGAV